MSLTHFDLFSGIGGFALAAKWAGFETIGFSEIDPFCCKILKKNFPNIKNYGDIKNINSLQPVGLMTGGFPCQPFSQAGNKKGMNDDRYLWPEFERVIRFSRPDWIVIENVYYLIQMGIENIIFDLAQIGYKSFTCILPAVAANAPHRRDRVWIIAYSDRIGSYNWLRDWSARQIQENIQWHMAQIQSKWTQFQPKSWATNTARDWLKYNARVSRRNDGISSRMDKDRIKALGNAIVPQVIYPVMAFIRNSYEKIS